MYLPRKHDQLFQDGNINKLSFLHSRDLCLPLDTTIFGERCDHIMYIIFLLIIIIQKYEDIATS